MFDFYLEQAVKWRMAEQQRASCDARHEANHVMAQAEDLPFTVEEWDAAGNVISRVLARACNVMIAVIEATSNEG